ncbi:MAG: menaquinone biosynthesis family protein [Armatimonadota bacterium]
MITISVAHSPDSDDAFMFYALAKEKIPTGDLRFTHTLLDIETLNQLAAESKYDVTALSFHGYAYRADRYRLLPCGASFGEDYGPKVVARRPLEREELRGLTVAIPGKLTTAALALQLYLPGVQTTILPFDDIIPALARGEVEAGVIIHEGQLTYQDEHLVQHVDLGVWWKDKTGLPLPLGGNGIRRELPEEVQRKVATYLRRAIDYSLAHREEALEYALSFSRGLDPGKADEFVGMYVNDVTRDYGERGRAAVRRLLKEACQAGIIPHPVEPDFVDWWEKP